VPLTAEQVTVNGKVQTYVHGGYANWMGDQEMVFDRYDDSGKLQHAETITSTGAMHTMIQGLPATAAASTVTGAVLPLVLPSASTTTSVKVNTGSK
jgi:hypothetical protein